jgi:hypothetical protein
LAFDTATRDDLCAFLRGAADFATVRVASSPGQALFFRSAVAK